jgi:hypothetical protein
MRQLEFYEFVGILIPGALVLVDLYLCFPLFAGNQKFLDLSIGGFGTLLLLAYATGHLVQSIGNALEVGWWKLWGGMPTDWPRHHSARLLSSAQRDALWNSLPDKLKISLSGDLSSISRNDWFAITRQMYAAVMSAGKNTRVDTFNGNYGLLRGVASALIIALVLVPITPTPSWRLAAVIFAAFCLAVARMHRFGKHYARELFVQFLQLPTPQVAA